MVSHEEAVFTLLIEANPFPTGDLDPSAMAGRAHLANLKQGSTDVTQLDKKPTEKKRSGSSMTWLVAAASILVVGTVALLAFNLTGDDAPPATGPVPTTIPATLESFEGVWDADGVEVQFAGGTYAISEGSSRSDIGQWELQDGRIILIAGTESEDCSAGARGVYEYEFVDSGRLRLTYVSDDCGSRRSFNGDTTTLTSGGTFETGDPDWDEVTVFRSPEGPFGLPPGDYRSGRFDVPFRFTLPEGWTSFLPERNDALTLASLSPDTDIEFHLFEPKTVLRTLELFDRGDLNMSPLAKIPGGYAVFFSPSESATLFHDPLDGDYLIEPGTEVLMSVVDVNGTPVTIIQRALDEGLAKSRAIIDRLVWYDN